MTFTERELALIMVALDNTSAQLAATNVLDQQQEATDMDDLWNRVHQERLELLQAGVEKR